MKKIVYVIILMIFFSCQNGNRDQRAEQTQVMVPAVEIVETTINVGGMYCNMCEASIEKGVNELEGISFVKATLADSTAVVKYDASKTDLAHIEQAIEKRGYSVKQAM